MERGRERRERRKGKGSREETLFSGWKEREREREERGERKRGKGIERKPYFQGKRCHVYRKGGKFGGEFENFRFLFGKNNLIIVFYC